METIYSTAKFCSYQDSTICNLSLEPGTALIHFKPSATFHYYSRLLRWQQNNEDESGLRRTPAYMDSVAQ